jgi:hypothetical protein
MKSSWRFFAGLGAGFILALAAMLLAFYLNLGVPTDMSRWAFEISQKKKLLAEKTPSPRILLVGGSATLFGISAQEMEKETGRRTLNLATFAGLGTSYLLHEAQKMIKPGDTVLLVLEYELYSEGKLTRDQADLSLIDYLMARDPAYLRSLSLPEQWNVFMLAPTGRLLHGLKRRWHPRPPPSDAGAYSVNNIDSWGDQIHHPRNLRPKNREAMQKKSTLARDLPEDAGGFAVVESFCQWARANHVAVLATYPNLYDQPEYHLPGAEHTAETIKNFFSRLDVPVVGNYTDSLLPADQFFDTVYHLTDEACAVRTRRLDIKLKPYLEGPNAQ